MALPSDRDLKVTASDALEFEPVQPEPPKRRLGVKLSVFLLVAGGAVGAWSYYGGQLQQLWVGGQGHTPLIKADPGPVKVRPENPGGLRVPDRDKLVYDRMQGQSGGAAETGNAGKGAERLLPPAEQLAPHPADAAGHADTRASLQHHEPVQSEQSTASAFVTPPARMSMSWHSELPFPLQETNTEPTGESANTSMPRQC